MEQPMTSEERKLLRAMAKSTSRSARTAVRRKETKEQFLSRLEERWRQMALYQFEQAAAEAELVAAKQFLPMEMMGRCADGAQRDSGYIVHAVPPKFHRAYCGKQPGRRSVGWAHREGAVVSCAGCLKKLNKET